MDDKGKSRKTINDLIREGKLIPYEQIFNEKYNTPAKKRRFYSELKKFQEDCRAELLKEMGQKVKRIRQKTGVTQEELALKINTSRTTITRIEKGGQNLTVDYIIKIATALGKRWEIRIY